MYFLKKLLKTFSRFSTTLSLTFLLQFKDKDPVYAKIVISAGTSAPPFNSQFEWRLIYKYFLLLFLPLNFIMCHLFIIYLLGNKGLESMTQIIDNRPNFLKYINITNCKFECKL